MRTLIAAVLVFAVYAPVASARTWTDSTGKHTVEAEFVEFKDGKAHLKKTDGKVITIPIERLSTEDQRFVKSQGRQDKPDVAQATKPPLAAADANDRDFALETIPLDEAQKMHPLGRPLGSSWVYGVEVFNKKTEKIEVLEKSTMDKLDAFAGRLDLSKESERRRLVAEVVRLLGEERARWGITIWDDKGRPTFRWPRADEKHTSGSAWPFEITDIRPSRQALCEIVVKARKPDDVVEGYALVIGINAKHSIAVIRQGVIEKAAWKGAELCGGVISDQVNTEKSGAVAVWRIKGLRDEPAQTVVVDLGDNIGFTGAVSVKAHLVAFKNGKWVEKSAPLEKSVKR